MFPGHSDDESLCKSVRPNKADGAKGWVNNMQKKEHPGLYLQSPKLNQMNILKELAADPHLTQAELAERCSLSVAMVNNYLKELCRAGLMEYHRRSIKSVTYHLTTAGMERLESLQRELTAGMVDMFVTSKEWILSRIVSQAHGSLKRVLLFGSGHLAQLVFHSLEAAQVNIIGVCDDEMEKVGMTFCGHQVLNPSQVRFLSPDAVVVAKLPRVEASLESIASFFNTGVQIIRLDDYAAPKEMSRPPERIPMVLA